MIMRTPCVSIFYLLLRPTVVVQWQTSLQETYKLDILFTFFKDILQFIAAIFMVVETRSSTYTFLSLAGSGLSIVFSMLTYLFRVKKSLAAPDENKPLVASPSVPYLAYQQPIAPAFPYTVHPAPPPYGQPVYNQYGQPAPPPFNPSYM